MFEASMSIRVLDETRLAPQTLGRNDEAHAVIQRRYALEELGYPVWGLSPSDAPGSGAYAEYGSLPLPLYVTDNGAALFESCAESGERTAAGKDTRS